MPALTILTVNSSFETLTVLEPHVEADEALAMGRRAAIAMIADEVTVGVAASSIAVTVSDAEKRPLRRVIVSLSVAPLLVA